MTTTELEINRASSLVDPELHIWGWQIPTYLFLGGLAAGLMILGALLGRRDPDEERSRWARWLPLAVPLLLCLGVLALFLDLANKWRVHRLYLAFRWSSPMSWGSWILVAVIPAALLLGLAALSEREAGKLAAWAPLRLLRIGGLVRRARALGLRHAAGVRAANVTLGIALGAYTGILLGTLGARPVWHSSLLGPLFLVSGFSTAAALMMIFPLRAAEHARLRRWDLGAIGLELALLAVFFLDLATGGAGSRQAAALFLGGRFTALFWALVVVAGLLVPLVIELTESRRRLPPTLVAPALLLVGGLSLRWILVVAGQAG
jgi:formate-dependent nitrite reductase membrane component NrfD